MFSISKHQNRSNIIMKFSSFSRIALILLVLTGAGISGCSNTWRGVGEDTERAGEKIQDSAN